MAAKRLEPWWRVFALAFLGAGVIAAGLLIHSEPFVAYPPLSSVDRARLNFDFLPPNGEPRLTQAEAIRIARAGAVEVRHPAVRAASLGSTSGETAQHPNALVWVVSLDPGEVNFYEGPTSPFQEFVPVSLYVVVDARSGGVLFSESTADPVN